MAPENEASEKPLRVRRARVDSVELYEITEHELSMLQQGSPASLYLNFSIALLSTALSCLFSLMTAEIPSMRAYVVFVVVVVVGSVLGLFLLVLWLRARSEVSKIIDKIKGRMPSEPSPIACTPAALGEKSKSSG